MTRYYRRYRRNARPNENEISTVRVVRRRANPLRRRNAPISKAEARVMLRVLARHGLIRRNPMTPDQGGGAYTMLAQQGMVTNPRRRRKGRRVKHHRKARRSKSRRKTPKPPKGTRVGCVFKRKGKWFRVGSVKVRKGRRKIRRRVCRKISARAARRARK